MRTDKREQTTMEFSKEVKEEYAAVYGRHSSGMRIAVCGWMVLRKAVLEDLRGRFTVEELEKILAAYHRVKFDPVVDFHLGTILMRVPSLEEKIKTLSQVERMILVDWALTFSTQQTRLPREYITDLLPAS